MKHYPVMKTYLLRVSEALATFRRIGLALLLLTTAGYVRADRVDDYVRAEALWMRIPGLSLAVVKDGKVIKAKGYGLANVETNTPATPETVYKIASVSKQFLAAAILVLVQENKVRLDDPIAKYLDSAPDTWKEVTVRRLLTHTSGIVREAPGFNPYEVESDAEVIRSAYSEPLRFASGEKWEYSNTGYFCLAEVIHRVSGKPWWEFVRERIFVPAGMTATQLANADIVPHRASGYETRGTLQNAENWLAVRPSGAFLSTVLDFARWDTALASDAILSASSRNQMWTPVTLTGGSTHPYGFGWFLDTVQGHKRVSHGGGVPGFVCEFQRYVDDKLSVIVMANVGSRDLGDVAAKIASFYVPALAPSLGPPAVPHRDPKVTAQVKQIVTDLAGGKVDDRLFTLELGTALLDDTKSGFSDILRQLGPVRSLIRLERQPGDAERRYRYRLTFRHIDLFVDCTFNEENKIVRFNLQD